VLHLLEEQLAVLLQLQLLTVLAESARDWLGGTGR